MGTFLSNFVQVIHTKRLKRLKGLPIMFWVQDLWPESLSATGAVHSERILGLVELIVRYIYHRCDRVMVTSRAFIPRVKAVGAAEEKILYWPQWAEPLYRPLDLESDAPELGEVPSGFRVMFAGNLGAAQSFETILAAAKKLEEYEEIQWVIGLTQLVRVS